MSLQNTNRTRCTANPKVTGIVVVKSNFPLHYVRRKVALHSGRAYCVENNTDRAAEDPRSDGLMEGCVWNSASMLPR